MPDRVLYLHGFASGPRSTKGLAFSAHFARLGVTIERLDLRLPSFERLRLSAGIAATRAAIGGPDDRAVLIGSSLGGLTAARVAAVDPRVTAAVLLAPAFCLSDRWRARLGAEVMRRWEADGWLEVDDHTSGTRARVDHGFFEDITAIDQPDQGWPDLGVPTLILHGVHDEIVDIALSRQFAAARSNVQLIELDDDHALTATLPESLAAAEAFFQRLGT